MKTLKQALAGAERGQPAVYTGCRLVGKKPKLYMNECSITSWWCLFVSQISRGNSELKFKVLSLALWRCRAHVVNGCCHTSGRGSRPLSHCSVDGRVTSTVGRNALGQGASRRRPRLLRLPCSPLLPRFLWPFLPRSCWLQPFGGTSENNPMRCWAPCRACIHVGKPGSQRNQSLRAATNSPGTFLAR